MSRSGGQPLVIANATAVQVPSPALVKLGPVLKNGGAGTFDQSVIEGFQVFWDPKSQRWAAVYAGYNNALSAGFPPTGSVGKVGLAWSNDLKTWTRDGASPILSPTGVTGDPDKGTITGPSVWCESGTYYLFYIGMPDTGYEGADGSLANGVRSSPQICLATATSLTGTWTRQGVVVPRTNTTSWRGQATWHPCVVKRGSVYYLFFNASPQPVTSPYSETIGYATASSPVGPWTVDDVNSPIVRDATPATIGDPYVWQDSGGTWWMAYGGGGGQGYLRDSLAWTTDASFPLGWTNHPANPVLQSDRTIDSRLCAKPCVIRVGGGIYHFYTQANTAQSAWNAGLAVSPDIAGPETWHAVGAAGEPAFGTNLTGFGTPFGPVQFRRNARTQEVEFAGVMKATGAVATFATLIALPEECWPISERVIYPQKNSAGQTRLDISAQGAGGAGPGILNLQGAGLVANDYLVLDGLSYSLL